MRRSHCLALASLTILASCRTAEAPGAYTPQPLVAGQPGPQITSVTTIPAGVAFETALNHVVGPTVNHVGDRFYATVLQPILTNFSEVVVPQGATVSGTITALSPADKGYAFVRLNFDQITWPGRTRRFNADVVTLNVQDPSAAAIKAADNAHAVAPAIGSVITGAELQKLVSDGTLTTGVGSVVLLGSEAFIPVGTRLVIRTSREVELN